MKIYFVIGESSGDALAAPLLEELRLLEPDVESAGLAGERLTALGVTSLFDIEDIAVMGIAPVVKRLPTIVLRVWKTVDHVIETSPDVLVIIDSPDFTHAVAKRVRKRLPNLPILNYVCPSVWAWRSGRARKMTAYVDHVLALLPFEPTVLEELGGPPATYVGHPLSGIASIPLAEVESGVRLLVLPGSRSSEHERLLPLFQQTLETLARRDVDFEATMPVPRRFYEQLQQTTSSWPVPVNVVISRLEGESFAGATAALAASGTVSLELALRGVPMVLAYRTDALMRAASGLIDTWSAALPNLIADRVVVPENIDAFARPERLARQVQDLLTDTPTRQAQMYGLAQVRTSISVPEPASRVAARLVAAYARDGRQREPIST